MNRITLDHWLNDEHTCSELVAEIRSLRTDRPHKTAQPVFTIKLIGDGWGYGKTLTGHITGVTMGLTDGEFGFPVSSAHVLLTQDTDRQILGWVKGDAFGVEIGEIEWVEHTGWVAQIPESELEPAGDEPSMGFNA